ncbi:potassium-transporting ATPase subunit KdpC [Sphingomonas rosea]|uniref:Potassium-transporting ATPase KdpC subunit n=1 Tax=Sphingomonas rosea TaxID=335605 RepID=A0ABP7U7Y4_9SPHN
MLTDIRTALRPALVLLLGLTLLTGLVYPLAITGAAQLIAPSQANGSLVRDGDRVIGSALVGQSFASPRYFHGRPSAAGAGYDASASSGSNLGPTSKTLETSIAERVAATRKDGASGPVPADLVTASGSGLDPDLSPAAALVQVRRVAETRGLAEARVRALVEAEVRSPLLGFLGEPRVNVLSLNRQLDRLGADTAR